MLGRSLAESRRHDVGLLPNFQYALLECLFSLRGVLRSRVCDVMRVANLLLLHAPLLVPVQAISEQHHHLLGQGRVPHKLWGKQHASQHASLATAGRHET